jgi:hypothetical protein
VVELGRIHQQCERVERSLRSPLNGEIELLRIARVLRRIHENLRAALIVRARAHGWNEDAAAVQTELDLMEGELRSALLGYPQVRGTQLREHVEDAFQHSLEAIDLLST